MFFDEGRFGMRTTLTKAWTEKGIPYTVKVQQGYQNFYVYSSVCHHDGSDFTLLMPEVNTQMMNIYLHELSNAFENSRIMLIMDQAGWHKSKDLKKYKNIEIIFLPPYSPELNPIERLWKWIKQTSIHNRIFSGISEMKDVFCAKYQKLNADDLERICSCSYLSVVK